MRKTGVDNVSIDCGVHDETFIGQLRVFHRVIGPVYLKIKKLLNENVDKLGDCISIKVDETHF